jgi:hypothetical protein
MIAPIRNRPTPQQRETTGPRHIGQLLSAVLARYGIVISEAELVALSPSRQEREPFASMKQTVPRRSPRISSGQVRRRPLRTTASAHRKMVQLPLFTTTDRAAVSSFAAR